MKARDKWEKRTELAERKMFSDLSVQIVALGDLYKLYRDCWRQKKPAKAKELKELAEKTLQDLERNNPLLLGETAEYRLARSHLHRFRYLFLGSEEALDQAIAEVRMVLEDQCTHDEESRATSISNSLLRLKNKPLPHHTT